MRLLQLAGMIVLAAVCPSGAQNATRGDVRAIAGATKAFLDEPFFAMGGGSLLLALSQRVHAGPEIIFSDGSGFREWSLQGRVVVYLTPPDRRAAPYLTATGGLLRCYDKRIDYTSQEASASGGFGVRMRIGRRGFVAPEVRLGTHAFPLAGVQVGYSF